jgi:hypothetical protein
MLRWKMREAVRRVDRHGKMKGMGWETEGPKWKAKGNATQDKIRQDQIRQGEPPRQKKQRMTVARLSGRKTEVRSKRRDRCVVLCRLFVSSLALSCPASPCLVFACLHQCLVMQFASCLVLSSIAFSCGSSTIALPCHALSFSWSIYAFRGSIRS